MIQSNMFSAETLTIIDDLSGLSVGEIRGTELRIFGRGITICSSREEAMLKAVDFLKQDIGPVTKKVNTNQINLL